MTPRFLLFNELGVLFQRQGTPDEEHISGRGTTGRMRVQLFCRYVHDQCTCIQCLLCSRLCVYKDRNSSCPQATHLLVGRAGRKKYYYNPNITQAYHSVDSKKSWTLIILSSYCCLCSLLQVFLGHFLRSFTCGYRTKQWGQITGHTSPALINPLCPCPLLLPKAPSLGMLRAAQD